MNKKILNAALILTPQRLQGKAIVKALDFLFPLGEFHFDDFRILKLEIIDLKRSWIVKVNPDGVKSVPVHEKNNADIILRARLDVILNSQEKSQLLSSLRNGEIEVSANCNDKNIIISSLNKLSQERLDGLRERSYSFFKIKQNPRFDIKTVTFDKLKTDRDIDWIRDQALKLESNNPSEALRLMELAYQARPNGPLIKKKVEEYRDAIS